MSAQYTKKFVKARFERLLEDVGNTGPVWTKDKNGQLRARIGAWYLDHASIYGGYNINEIVNEGGGIQQVNGYCNRLSGKELVAWMDGFALGRTGRRA